MNRTLRYAFAATTGEVRLIRRAAKLAKKLPSLWARAVLLDAAAAIIGATPPRPPRRKRVVQQEATPQQDPDKRSDSSVSGWRRACKVLGTHVILAPQSDARKKT